MTTSHTLLITGATSGFGAATARIFVDAGWRVIGTGRRADRLAALSDELGDDFHAAVFDIRDAVERDAALDALPNAFRGIDLLVNNAGVALGIEKAQAASLANWQAMVDTNVSALMAITHRLLPMLIERRGAIINLASVAATHPSATTNVYAATKAFVRQLSLCLRADLAGTGVRVTSLEPGMARTEFRSVRTGTADDSDQAYAGVDPMTAEDLAKTILWIAELPPHLNVNTLEIMPVNQSFSGFSVHRNL